MPVDSFGDPSLANWPGLKRIFTRGMLLLLLVLVLLLVVVLLSPLHPPLSKRGVCRFL
jgi:hypothetical protein